ncbi:MAG: metallophosphoesterase [Candidatus Thermoplasmatota archaeon]
MSLDKIIENIENNPDSIKALNKERTEMIIKKAVNELSKDKTFLEKNGETAFIGDTHGDFDTTKKIFKEFKKRDFIIFLGDYVDREPMPWGSIYNINFLLSLKVKYPKKIFLLKGNHETNHVIPCFPHELKTEVKQKYGSIELYEKYVHAFKEMPLMAYVNQSIFAAHGGILKNYNKKELQNIDKNEKDALTKLVWSDPLESPTFRGTGNPYGKDDLKDFLDNIDAKVFIKGHDPKTNGMSIYDDKCLTIFSSTRYKKMGNHGVLAATAKKPVNSVNDLNVWNLEKNQWNKYIVYKK